MMKICGWWRDREDQIGLGDLVRGDAADDDWFIGKQVMTFEEACDDSAFWS